jgi:LysR family transcriptional activator of nhaA
MNWINYNHLLYFREIANLGSIAKASEKLMVSPPALSSQLKIFEDFVGEELFDRVGRKLVLNDFGKRVLEYAEKVNQVGEELIYFINHPDSITKHQLKLGFSDALPKTMTREMVGLVRKKYKDCSLTVLEGDRKDLRKKLISNELDIIFTNRITYDEAGEIISRRFGEEQVSLYGTENFLELKKHFPKSIEGAPLILPNLHSDIRHTLDQWFIEKKLRYSLVAEVQDSSVKKILAKEGMGMVPLPDYGARQLVQNKDLYKIGKFEGVTEKYYWTTRKRRRVKNQVLEYLLKKIS